MFSSVVNTCVSELIKLHNSSLEWETFSYLTVIIITIFHEFKAMYTLYYNEKHQRELLFAASDFISDSRFLIACKSGDVKMVEQMIIHGADIYARNMYGEGAIHMATYYHTANLKSNNMKLIILLINAGCPVNVFSNTGCTPLHIAAAAGHLELVRVLLIYGANRHVKPHPGHIAHTIGHYKAAKLLKYKPVTIQSGYRDIDDN